MNARLVDSIWVTLFTALIVVVLALAIPVWLAMLFGFAVFTLTVAVAALLLGVARWAASQCE